MGRRSLRRPKRRWEDNVRMDINVISVETEIVLIHLRIGISGES